MKSPLSHRRWCSWKSQNHSSITIEKLSARTSTADAKKRNRYDNTLLNCLSATRGGKIVEQHHADSWRKMAYKSSLTTINRRLTYFFINLIKHEGYSKRKFSYYSDEGEAEHNNLRFMNIWCQFIKVFLLLLRSISQLQTGWANLKFTVRGGGSNDSVIHGLKRLWKKFEDCCRESNWINEKTSHSRL